MEMTHTKHAIPAPAGKGREGARAGVQKGAASGADRAEKSKAGPGHPALGTQMMNNSVERCVGVHSSGKQAKKEAVNGALQTEQT